MSWTRARYLSNSLAAHGVLQVTPSRLAQVQLNAVPIHSFDSTTDPITIDAAQTEAVFLQLDPLLCIHKIRTLARRIVENKTSPVHINHLTDCMPQALAECTVTVQNLEMMAQGEQFVQGQSIFNVKDPKQMTSDILATLQEHAYNSESRWHYLNMALFPAVMTRKPVILGDIPEPVLRCTVANTVSIAEMRDVFARVVSVLQHHYKHSTELLTPSDAFQDLYPHILSPPRDRYLASMLRWTASVHSSVSAWVGVQHAGPVTDLWEKAPDLSESAKVPERKAGESDSDLLEKHAILEVLIGSETWSQSFLRSPFPYLALASTDPMEWEKWRQHYETQLEAVEVPEELARQVQEAIGKSS